MDIWHYNSTTGELVGQGVADQDPLNPTNMLVPAFATTVAPPEPQNGMAIVYAEEVWGHVADHRGETWWTSEGVATVVAFLGAPAAHGLSSVKPAVSTPVPTEVTRKQMLIGLKRAEYITSAEAIAAATNGVVPAGIQAIIDTLATQDARDDATIEWASMLHCERTSPIVAALQASKGLTDAEVDALFVAWALI